MGLGYGHPQKEMNTLENGRMGKQMVTACINGSTEIDMKGNLRTRLNMGTEWKDSEMGIGTLVITRTANHVGQGTIPGLMGVLTEVTFSTG